MNNNLEQKYQKYLIKIGNTEEIEALLDKTIIDYIKPYQDNNELQTIKYNTIQIISKLQVDNDSKNFEIEIHMHPFLGTTISIAPQESKFGDILSVLTDFERCGNNKILTFPKTLICDSWAIELKDFYIKTDNEKQEIDIEWGNRYDRTPFDNFKYSFTLNNFSILTIADSFENLNYHSYKHSCFVYLHYFTNYFNLSDMFIKHLNSILKEIKNIYIDYSNTINIPETIINSFIKNISLKAPNSKIIKINKN